MTREHDAAERDVYAHLLRDTRGLRRDQADARETWYEELPWPHKEATLFELEMLLKGLGCFPNTANHPGPGPETPGVAHDFREETRILRDALERCVELIRTLLGDKDRVYTFARYLESVLPEDTERSRLVEEQLTQNTPQESLFLLRNSFTSYLELAESLLRLEHVSHRQHHALLDLVVREIGRNAYFNPLVPLEFRPEFDRIREPHVLEALHTVQSTGAHRVVALTFLTAFRALRYLALVDQYAVVPEHTRLAYIVLAGLRSDIRTLTRFLERRAPDVLADGLERELMQLPAQELASRYEELARHGAMLSSLRSTLGNLANTLRVDFRRAFERELAPPDTDTDDDELGGQLATTSASLRASVHYVVQQLCAELRPGEPLPELESDAQAQRAASERLRRDIWMFLKILRAFLAKAEATDRAPDEWHSWDSFRYVREFLGHFRAIGYQLVRASDSEQLEQFLTALGSLRDADVLDRTRMEQAVRQCRAFYDYLEDLFHKVSQRAELQDVPFDRDAAAETLRAYLGAA